MKPIKESTCRTSCCQEPLSPSARLFQEQQLNCYIIAALGWKTSTINPSIVKEGLEQTLIKHPRFSSKLVAEDGKGRKLKWVRTKVNVNDHVIVPNLDRNMDSPDRFVEDYISNLSTIPMDNSKPLWEMHLLDVQTSENEAVVVFKLHHSMGDGASLISVLLACSRKTLDPKALPSLPVPKRAGSSCTASSGLWSLFLAMWTALRMIWNTAMDFILFAATILCLKDTNTPLKGTPGVELKPKRFVHRIVSMDDIKMVKNAMNTTINDVVMGVIQAGLSRYLNRKFGGDSKIERGGDDGHGKSDNGGDHSDGVIKVTFANLMAEESNIPKWGWGNWIGIIILPITISLENDPLDYVRRAKATIDRKKLSLKAVFTFRSVMFILKLFGTKAAAATTHRTFCNTTITFSNVVGPIEEISLFGHPIAYIAPTIYGTPHALTIHAQSYSNKMAVVLGVDPDVIPNPHELCDDLEESLKIIKDAVVERGLNAS
ncbi:unnamed protein product [Dovyalis caffra]|uniref:Diacylglycerol O-acyltransferase n=1 Tax=Dovyalis caffra TaxID=77055 RepID=A0AAV1QTI9_9ROSI|nr:unnamed protein product [Dovyalis caffra]